MTTNPAIHSTAESIIALSHAIMESPDCLDLIEHLKPLMPPVVFADLCACMDICPIHLTDLDTCADDDLSECADLRS